METLGENGGSRVGVVGLGAVGGALKHTLEFFYDVYGYDVKGEYSWDDILQTDIVFICVNTPEGDDGRLDCQYVTEVLQRLATGGYPNPVVVRSTIRIGYMDEATALFPDLRLVYSPEFLREKSRFQWSVCPDRIVLSGNPGDVQEVRSYFDWAEEAVVLVMDHRSAEVAKLAHNGYIATKVSFTNEMEWICEKVGADPLHVMDVIAADRRVGSHEHLHPYLGPFGGKCVPKDTAELMNAVQGTVLLRAVNEVNELAKSRSWAMSAIAKASPEGKLHSDSSTEG